MAIKVRFKIRGGEYGGYTFDYLGDAVSLPHLPDLGDLVVYGGGVWQVVSRQWEIPDRGSMMWSSLKSGPSEIGATVIVVAADGLYAGEAS